MRKTLYRLMQHAKRQRRFQRITHAVAKKQYLIDAELKLSVQRTGNRFQMVTLAGDISIFQYHNFAPGQEGGKDQDNDKTEVNNQTGIATLMQPLQKRLFYNKGIVLHTHSLIVAHHPI